MSKQSSLAVVETDSESFETKGEIQRTPDGRFAEGTCGGPGGSRPGSGRKPAPADETLLKRLYDLLDQNADKALQVLVDQLEDKDPKIAQKAASIILAKTLPESRFLRGWEERNRGDVEELEFITEFLEWKAQRDLEEARAIDGEETTRGDGDGSRGAELHFKPI